MRVIKYGIVIIIAIIAIAIISTFFMPSNWDVTRNIEIQAGPEQIFPYINNIRTWPEWTAWNTNKYPEMRVTYSGPDQGEGATQTWEGGEAGQGSITIITSDSNRGIQYDLQFEEGKYRVDGFILLNSNQDGTKVTWTNRGDVGANPIGKFFALFMDRVMGPDIEEGLRNLKNIVEKTNDENTP